MAVGQGEGWRLRGAELLHAQGTAPRKEAEVETAARQQKLLIATQVSIMMTLFDPF